MQCSMQLNALPSACILSRLQRCRTPAAALACSRHGEHGRGGVSAAPLSCRAFTRYLASAWRTFPAPPGNGNRLPTAAAAATASKSSSGASGGEDSAGRATPPSWPPPLEDWLRSHGGTVNGVELRSVLFPSGAVDRQLVSACDQPAGALLISVPRMLQLRYDNIEEAAAAAAAATASATASAAPNASGTTAPADGDGEPNLGGSLAIPAAGAAAVTALYDMMPRGSDTGASAWPFKQALTILYHLSRGPASPLLPYLAHLPGLAPGVPTPRVAMLMYDDAVDELQYGVIVQDVRNQKYWLRHVSNEVLGRLHGAPDSSPATGAAGPISAAAGSGAETAPAAAAAAAAFGGLEVDQELFGWAVAVAMSRCFGLTRFQSHTCVPLIDMANHVAPYSASNCEIRTGPAGEVAMYAKRQIRAGEELTLTYGTHDNHNLLLSYGFTLQPNPNDAFYFDMDLSTVESLVEDLVGDSGGGGSGGGSVLAPWQLKLLESKLGLRRPGDGDTEGGKGGGALRVYLAATVPTAAEAALASAAGGATDGEGEAGVMRGDEAAVAPAAAGSSPAAKRVVVRQPVDPKLLAALRIATLQDETWFRILSTQSAEQIGGWGNLLARQQETTIMRLLAALVTALYTTFPTTIQQDRQLLASASLDVAASTASATLSPASPNAGPSVSTNVGTAGHSHSSGGGGGGWALLPAESAATAGSGSGSDPAAAATAAHARDMAEAIRFRLGLKTTLERCLQALVARAKELDSLQEVRRQQG